MRNPIRMLVGAMLGVMFLMSSFHEVKAQVAAPAPVLLYTPWVMPVAMVAQGITAVIATQKDQYDEPVYHRLACALFGDEGRVGMETDSACKHIE